MKFNFLLALVAILFSSFACNQGGDTAKTEEAKKEVAQQPTKPQTQKLNPVEQKKVDLELIEKYIADNKLENVQKTASGIHYVITKEGEGDHPNPAAHVTVNYKGALLNGAEFDANNNIEFGLNRVIRGWTEGIPLLKKGGSGKLIIPSGLAYGARAMGPKIPANSVLVFDVDLIDFHNH